MIKKIIMTAVTVCIIGTAAQLFTGLGLAAESEDGDVTIEEAREDLDSIELPYVDDIRGNITLPDVGIKHGSSITWKSSDANIITDCINSEGQAAGVVKRQDTDAAVTLTAAISVGDEEISRAFEVKVKAKCNFNPETTTDYLFAYFVSDNVEEEQIYFATSQDGNNWMDINNDEPVLDVREISENRTETDISENRNNPGVRDPYIIRSYEGDRFYLIATDLSFEIQGGSGPSSQNGSRCIRVWESDDLVNWSEPWLAEIAAEDSGCAWAPEAIYDEETGDYVVFWSATKPDGDDSTTDYLQVYYSTTRDFRTFSEEKIFISGTGNVLDATMIKAGDMYYRAYCNGDLKIEKSTSVTSGWTSVGNLRTAMKNAGVNGDYDNKTGDFVNYKLEGTEFFKYNKDDALELYGAADVWGFMADLFREKTGYLPFRTTDIGDIATGQSWTMPESDEYNYDTKTKRHGGILNLTSEEYQRIMEAYGPVSIEVHQNPNKTQYAVGETFDPDGLILTVNYSNGRACNVTYPVKGIASDMEMKNKRQFTFGDIDSSELGEHEVSITYGHQTTTLNITVDEPQRVDRIKIEKATTFRDKLEYDVSVSSDNGVLITAVYDNDGRAVYINTETVNGKNSFTKTFDIFNEMTIGTTKFMLWDNISQMKPISKTTTADWDTSKYEILWDMTSIFDEKTTMNLLTDDTYEYNSLTIKGRGENDYIDVTDGLHFNGKSAIGNDSDRYIKYTADTDGIMSITAKCSYNNGKLYYSTDSSLSGGVAIENLSNNTAWQMGSIEVKAGTTYYFYCVDSGMKIQSMKFQS